MKKFVTMLLVGALAFTLAACAEEEPQILSVYFVPSRDAAEILTATEPLEALLLAELEELGYEFDAVEIAVGTTYEAVGEGLVSGSVDVGFIPGGTYALYSSEGLVDVVLAATRGGLNKDSDRAIDWNDGLPTEGDASNQVTYYRSLVIAGQSEVGRMLADKVNAGEELTWEDLNAATWCLQSPTSSAGTIYPSVYLFNNYGKTATDLASVVRPGGYGPTIAGLAAGNCDLSTIYADARRDHGGIWAETRNGANIWDETDVIIVTDGIFNDTISVSTVTVDADLKDALAQAFINIIETDEGKEIFAIYNHQGYKRVDDADYEGARTAQEILAGN